MKLVSVLILLVCFQSIVFSQAKNLIYPFHLEPNPNRFENTIEGFELEDALNPPPFGAIVCTGSSSMRLWHERMRADLPGLSLIARGFGGSHYTDVIYFFDALVFNYRPRALVIYEGDNDASFGKSYQRIFKDFKYLVKLCLINIPEMRIYVIGSKPSPSRWSISGEMQKTNALIKAYCLKNPSLTYVDVWPHLTDSKGEPRRELFKTDQLHLNELGYDQWAKAIAPVLINGEAHYE